VEGGTRSHQTTADKAPHSPPQMQSAPRSYQRSPAFPPGGSIRRQPQPCSHAPNAAHPQLTRSWRAGEGTARRGGRRGSPREHRPPPAQRHHEARSSRLKPVSVLQLLCAVCWGGFSISQPPERPFRVLLTIR